MEGAEAVLLKNVAALLKNAYLVAGFPRSNNIPVKDNSRIVCYMCGYVPVKVYTDFDGRVGCGTALLYVDAR